MRLLLLLLLRLNLSVSHQSIHHHSRVVPVELLPCHGQCPSHALEYVAHSLVRALDLSLVSGFSRVNRLDNALSICTLQRNACEIFLEPEVNVSILEIVIVDLDGA